MNEIGTMMHVISPKNNKINQSNKNIKHSIVRLQSYDISQHIPNTTTKDVTIIKTNIRQAHRKLKDIRLKSHDLRHEHLTQCQRYLALVDNKTHVQFIKNLAHSRETKIDSQINHITLQHWGRRVTIKDVIWHTKLVIWSLSVDIFSIIYVWSVYGLYGLFI